MVIQKLIMQDLVASQKIDPEDMIAFYDRFSGRSGAQENDNSTMMDEKKLVLKLRMEKSQEHFGEWLQKIQESYPVQIDQLMLSTFLLDVEKH